MHNKPAIDGCGGGRADNEVRGTLHSWQNFRPARQGMGSVVQPHLIGMASDLEQWHGAKSAPSLPQSRKDFSSLPKGPFPYRPAIPCYLARIIVIAPLQLSWRRSWPRQSRSLTTAFFTRPALWAARPTCPGRCLASARTSLPAKSSQALCSCPLVIILTYRLMVHKVLWPSQHFFFFFRAWGHRRSLLSFRPFMQFMGAAAEVLPNGSNS
jgi:hypothetical protein